MAQENDVVLVYQEDIPILFARIEDIKADHKKDWYHVKMLILQVPLQVVTWILKDIYIDGTEFTMNGKRMRLELVECPITDEPEEDAPPKPEKKPENAKVISFSDLKKN